ncbi:MAG: alpha/beta hydrolase-fold protein [Ignavibacteriaceae bacterium]|nr:alpha/beta hydrolase-fold protein [Ignavibacteriaceae bacterium]
MFRSNRKTLQNLLIITILLILDITCVQNSEQQNIKDQKNTEVTLFNTEKRILHSEIINDDFEIYISLPYRYIYTDTTYPVLFNLDANIGFGITDNVVHILSTLNKEIPEMIVVGIAYTIKGIEDWATWRCRDFRPTSHPEKDKAWQDRLSQASSRDDIVVESGGADKFLAFIREELIPFIESNYRVDSSDRAIAGVSASGLFTLYTLFQHPETFQRYFAGSPSISWDEPYMYKLENNFAASHNDLQARLFMCAGGLESESYINNMNKMAELLRSRKYPSLEIETVIFENETHGSIYQAAISRALKMLYKK